jgi:hypothetical protein
MGLEGEHWIHLSQHQWQAIANTVMNYSIE